MAPPKERATINAWTFKVKRLTFSPDGRLLAAAFSNSNPRGGSDGVVKLFDVASGECKAVLQHTSEVNVASFSPDGKTIVSSTDEGCIKRWDVATGACLSTWPVPEANVMYVTWTPDGKSIVAGYGTGEVKVLDPADGKVRATLEGLEGAADFPFVLSYSPDGKTLAVGTEGGLHLFDAATLAHRGPKGTLPQDSLRGAVNCSALSWAPDGKAVVTSSANAQKGFLWSAEDGAPKAGATLEGHDDMVAAVAWSPNGKTIATGSDDKSIKLWSPEGGAARDTVAFDAGGHIDALAWSPDGRTLAVGTHKGIVRLMDMGDEHAVGGGGGIPGLPLPPMTVGPCVCTTM